MKNSDVVITRMDEHCCAAGLDSTVLRTDGAIKGMTASGCKLRICVARAGDEEVAVYAQIDGEFFGGQLAKSVAKVICLIAAWENEVRDGLVVLEAKEDPSSSVECAFCETRVLSEDAYALDVEGKQHQCESCNDSAHEMRTASFYTV